MRLLDLFRPKPKHDPVPRAPVMTQYDSFTHEQVIADRKAHVTRLMQRQNAKGLVAGIAPRDVVVGW